MRTPRRSNSRFGAGALLFGTAVTLAAPTGAGAVDLNQRVAFDIQPQNLVSALIDFSRQSDLQVMSDGSDLRHRRAPGVHGQYAVGKALDLLLAGSGLSYKAAGPSTVAVVAVAPVTALVDPPVEAPVKTAEAAPLERIEITGSHIPGSEAATVENVQVISSQEIQSSGQETVADYLRTITSTFGNNSNESFSNSFAPGAAMIGLRGLSQKDTLVLLNGRRITNYGLFLNLSDSFVDLNVIPLTAIDHIEVVRSGGSAIYGSDAIAGVINIILKQKATEKTVEAGGRVTTEGGAASYEASALVGIGNFQTDNYNVVLGLSGFRRNQLLFSQRDNTKSLDFRKLPDGILGLRPSNQYIDPTTGATSAFPSCGKNGLPGQVISGSQGLGCYYNDATYLPLLPATDRGNLTATGNLRLAADWTAFGDVFISTIKTTSNFTPRNLGPGAWVFNPANGGVTTISNVLPGTNPAALGGQPTPIFYDFQSVGPRNVDTISNTYRVSGGVKGSWQYWDWDAAYGHSENNVTSSNINGINAPVLVSEIANGSFSFLDPLSTPAANNALRVGFGYSGLAKLDTLGFNGTGGIFDLPAGKLVAAAGLEFRHESADEEPSASLAQGLVLNTGVTKAVASRTVSAAYAEFEFPIIQTLEANLAGREEHYTGGPGSNFSPQATLRWQPVREFTFRAVGSKGFRAPSLAEGSRSTSLANQTASDPNDPLHRPSEAVGFITGGNPNLKPETSKNLYIGFVVSPFDNLTFSVDYYSIWLYSIIAPNGSAQSIINNPSAYPPGSITRLNGAVVDVTALYTNLYRIRTDGVDFEGDVTFPLADASKLKFELNATYVPTFLVYCGISCAGPPTPWQEYAGTNGWLYASPISGGGPVPHWKGLISAAWQNHEWTGQIVGRFVDRYTNIFSTSIFGNLLTQKSVSPYSAIDLYGQYRWSNWKFSLSVVNLTDNKPPYDSSNLLLGTFAPPVAQPYDISTYDDLGRMIDLHISYTF